MSGSNDSSGLSLEIWAGRALADRLRGCPPAHRELHRWVLRSFVAGRTPGAEHLRRKADALDVELDAALADLEQRDAVWMDPEAHAVRVAYPFSGVPTSHEVALRESGATAFAMCAVDALGVSFMVHQTTIVRSRDPVGDNRARYPTPDALAADAGQCPVAIESGKRRAACFRWACDKRLRAHFGVLADSTRHWHPWARQRYRAAFARGQDHPHACRTLGRAWARVLWRCWQDRVPYDPAKHGALARQPLARAGAQGG